ncbi:MAG: TylF/MycF/NovP-related O-methyltransferase, partial [Thermoanaerobaculia bacterium]
IVKNRSESGEYAIKAGGFHPGQRSYERLAKLVELFEKDHFVPSRPRIELVKGDIRETVPKYVKDNPGLRISTLLLDCDVYEPTLVGLKYLFPLVVSGGLVILDEYAQEKFAGESAAFEEYFGSRRPKVMKSHLNSNPSAYFIKEG